MVGHYFNDRIERCARQTTGMDQQGLEASLYLWHAVMQAPIFPIEGLENLLPREDQARVRIRLVKLQTQVQLPKLNLLSFLWDKN